MQGSHLNSRKKILVYPQMVVTTHLQNPKSRTNLSTKCQSMNHFKKHQMGQKHPLEFQNLLKEKQTQSFLTRQRRYDVFTIIHDFLFVRNALKIERFHIVTCLIYAFNNILQDEHSVEATPTHETLLSEHMVRWYKVRKRWKTSSAKNEERYKGSMNLLKDMFEKQR